MPDICAGCKEPITTGNALTALGKTYHPNHFTCDECQKPITDKQFHEREGKPLCLKDYEKALPSCFQCKKKITGTVVKAMDKTWHDDHFICGSCKCKLQGQQFMNVSGVPKCQACYNKEHGKKCKKCGFLIESRVLIAFNEDWHPECFQCKKCQKPVEETKFCEEDGHPVHITCP